MGDEFIGEGEIRYEVVFFELEYGGESIIEEDIFNSSEGNKVLGEGGIFVGNLLKGLVGFFVDVGNGVDGIEEVGVLRWFFDVGINEKGVGFGVDVFYYDLEVVEVVGFGNLDFGVEMFDKVFIDNIIGGGEEGEDVGDEEFFVIVEFVVLVVEIFGEIDFFSSLEGSFGFFVYLLDL